MHHPATQERTSENAPSRNCPKSLGRAHCVALRDTESVLFGPFRAPYAAKYGVGALLVTLFGQFHRERSRKFAVAISGRARAGVVVKAQIFYPVIIFEGAVATSVARDRCKPLRLATSDLPEIFKNR